MQALDPTHLWVLDPVYTVTVLGPQSRSVLFSVAVDTDLIPPGRTAPGEGNPYRAHQIRTTSIATALVDPGPGGSVTDSPPRTFESHPTQRKEQTCVASIILCCRNKLLLCVSCNP